MVTKDILTELTTAELAAAVEENLFDLFRAMTAALPESDLFENEKLGYHLTFPSNPMFKGVWRTRLSADESDDAIENTITWFRERNAPFFFWWTGPSTQPDDLGQRLAAHGLLDMAEQMHQMAASIVSTSHGAPGMAADLSTLNEAILDDVIPGFTIAEVHNEQDLQDFKRVLIEGYEMADIMADGWLQAARGVDIGNTPWKMYLGRLNGDPVATNMLFTGGGVAGIYGVATVPAVRRKGVGAAISLFPLLKAREMGYRYAVLFSTEMAVRVYERIGFRHTGMHINRYLWRNA